MKESNNIEFLGSENLILPAPVVRAELVDLGKIGLYVFDHERINKRLVKKYAKAALRGALFPAVVVHETDSEYGDLALSTGVKNKTTNLVDGGHHRALAHYISEVPLLVAVMDSTLSGESLPSRVKLEHVAKALQQPRKVGDRSTSIISNYVGGL